MTNTPDPRRELAMVQLWETLSTVAKAGFFFLATPLLLHRLGASGYGALAMALSVTAVVIGLDFGVRPYLRVALSALPKGTSDEWRPVVAKVLAAFIALQASGLLLVGVGARLGLWSRWLGTGPSGDGLLFVATLGGGLYLLSLLMIEPLAANRRLSVIKAAGFVGNALSVPAVVVAAQLGGDARVCFISYCASLIAPNVIVAAMYIPDSFSAVLAVTRSASVSAATRILFEGRWFGLSNAQWLLQSYLMTFLVSGLFGPAQAGRFFILLKLSELLSVFGANTSETSIAELAASHRPMADRRHVFRSSYLATLAASVLVFAFLCSLVPVALERWFHFESVDPTIGIWVGAFGLAGAFKRVVNSACLGLNLVRPLAIWEFVASTISLGGLLALHESLGGISPFAAGIASALALIVPARMIADALGAKAGELWGQPAFCSFVGVLTSVGCSLAAHRFTGILHWAILAAACMSGVLTAANYIQRIQRHASTTP